MGIELARIFVKVRGDNSDLPEDFEQTKALANQSMRDIADSMAGIFHKASNMIGGFLSKGISGATQYERTVTEFETLIGSAEETEKTLQRLTTFAAKTPFEMPQLLGVSRGLIQFGERGEGMMDSLQMIGDAAQGDAEKFGRLGRVFNDVRGVGKLMTQDFRQMSTQGIISLQDIAKYYGKTTQEAESMLSHGKISFEEFRKILKKTTEEGGRNYMAMERQSKTLHGLKSTLADAVGITARLLAQPLLPYLKALTIVQIKVVEGFMSIVQAMGPAAAGFMLTAKAVSALGLALTSASLAARFFGITLKAAVMGTGIGAVLIIVGGALGAIVMWIAEAVTKTAGWKATLVALTSAWNVLIEAAKVITDSLLEVWESVFGSSLTESIGKAAGYIAGLLYSVAKLVVSVKDKIIEMAETIGFFFRNFGSIWEIALLDMYIAAIDRLESIKGVFKAAFAAIGSGMGSIADGFMVVWAGAGAFFATFTDNFIQGLMHMKHTAGAVWESIKAGYAALVSDDENESITGAMGMAFDKEMKKFKDKRKDPFEEGGAAMEEARKDIKRRKDQERLDADRAKKDKPEKEDGMREQLERRKQELLDGIAASEEARRNKKKVDAEPGKDGDDKKKEDKPKADPKVDAGRYGFEAFGDKFQDAILKAGEGNEQKQMVGLLEQGNKTQDEMLKETKKKKGGLGK